MSRSLFRPFSGLLRHPVFPAVTAGCAARILTRNLTNKSFNAAFGARPRDTTSKTWLGLGTAGFALVISLSIASQRKVYSDAPSSLTIEVDKVGLQSDEEVVVDPATSIAFPTALKVPAKVKIPTLSLLGVGVRTVSFLGIKVYSVGFYADLDNPNLKIPRDMSPEEKVKHIVNNTTCVVRIVPTRSTSYSHLRDAFMRTLQERMGKAKLAGTLTEDEATAVGSPMRKLKTLFPNASLAKHTPFEILLAAPVPGRPRSLVFRDLGTIENDWVATELLLHYFEGNAPSPALKKSVMQKLEPFEK
ncbi:hypothetical protein AX15_000166 [Amanita polypyramis BW_CC]|nr:hypothetical protein AX15_000166 [Amanita polypyramis BW_CC]